MKGKCECGKTRPYRRAYKCFDCWTALSARFKEGLLKARRAKGVGKNDGTGTLCLRGVGFNG